MKNYEHLIPLVEYYFNHENIELEISVGTVDINTKKFVSGVCFDYFQELFYSLENTTKENNFQKTGRKQYASFFFPDNKRGQYQGEKTKFLKKQTLYKVDFVNPLKKYDIRITCSEEKPLSNFLPETFNWVPLSCRLQQRWSFVYKNQWRYDISKVASGRNRSEAIRSGVVFEIELESIKKPNKRDQRNPQAFAECLLNKANDLLGGNTELNKKPKDYYYYYHNEQLFSSSTTQKEIDTIKYFQTWKSPKLVTGHL